MRLDTVGRERPIAAESTSRSISRAVNRAGRPEPTVSTIWRRTSPTLIGKGREGGGKLFVGFPGATSLLLVACCDCGV